MIIVYTPKVTNRIKYVLETVFGGYYDTPYIVTDNQDYPRSGEDFVISYSPTPIVGCFNIYQHPLLCEETIHPQELRVSRVTPAEDYPEGVPVFFQTSEPFTLPFDIFSCIFYLLSRYEEYLPHEQDEHGRYMSSNSILARPEFNFSPIVEIWLQQLQEKIKNTNSSIYFKEQTFQYIPTIDIDNAFAFKGRNWWKNPPNIFNKKCLPVLLGCTEDPYNTVGLMVEEIEKSGHNPFLFFLLSDKTKQDSNVQPTSKHLSALLKKYQHKTLGIHPSYSSTKTHHITAEKAQLERYKKPILFARQHFLKSKFPDYCYELIQAGITKDFSLAYPDIVGFRAGFSKEFKFFDLCKNETTSLCLQPSCWMDATYAYYQTKTEEEVKEEFLIFFKQLKKINANLVTIFHNDLFATDKYRGIFNYIHQKISSR